ncbi:MAG TPA: hypothetical protein PK537_07635 [Candidatus Limiplasma sp.]|nr:hypothetical protein [Candidatus Limiplasma sp.]
MKKWFLILLALALPLTGAAAQENTVVALPTVAPLEAVEVADDTDYSTASLGAYYASVASDDVFDYQMPHLVADEAERAAVLLADYQAGARPQQNVLNKLDNVTVGVYTLNAEDYEGETLYTLLPIDPLTDEQILEVIDAFAQCGQTFDPDALSYKNCMRGGGIEASRFIQDEENERRNVLAGLYVRQGFQSETAYTPLVPDDGLGMVTLDEEAYCGLDCFTFFPCRQMTDDELLRYVIYTETGDPTQYGNYAAYEKQLRLELARLLGAPLSTTREYETICRMGDCDISYDDETAYYAQFLALDGTQYSGYLDVDTGKVLTASAWNDGGLVYSDLHLDPFDEKWLAIAADAVIQARGDSMAIKTVQGYGEITLQDAGCGALVDVIMEDGSHYNVEIAYQNEAVFGGLFYESREPDLLKRMYADGIFE